MSRPQATPTYSLSARVSPEVRAGVDHYAAQWGVSPNQAIERLLRAGIDSQRAALAPGEAVTLARPGCVEVRIAMPLPLAPLGIEVLGAIAEYHARADERAKVEREHGSRIFKESTEP